MRNVWLTVSWWRYQVMWRLMYWRLRLTGTTVTFNGPRSGKPQSAIATPKQT